MPQIEIMQATGNIFKGFWKWHVENIGLMTEALLRSQRAGIASLGRELNVATSPKHSIKRVDKFLSNDKVPDIEMLVRWMKWVIGPRKQIGISCDWTKIGDWPVLVASLVYQGRSIPLLWSVMELKTLQRSVNTFENNFFLLLKRLLPSCTKSVLLMDRGFKRISLLEHIDDLGFSYIIRSGGNTWLMHDSYEGYLQNLIRQRGVIKDITQAQLRFKSPHQARVVALWDKEQAEPWILVTNMLAPSARQIAQWYGKRFQIEETFRDHKSQRFGLALGELKLFQAKRLERLLFIVVIAHWLAMMMGLLVRAQGLDIQFRANTGKKPTQHSDFTLGRYYILRLPWHFQSLLDTFYRQLLKLGG